MIDSLAGYLLIIGIVICLGSAFASSFLLLAIGLAFMATAITFRVLANR